MAARENGNRAMAGSIIEHLVPEIALHVMSYLDRESLCRLSMTNSSMRRIANDDRAWEALYHKGYGKWMLFPAQEHHGMFYLYLGIGGFPKAYLNPRGTCRFDSVPVLEMFLTCHFLFEKDFTAEQAGISPPNGWKAYYAATKAVIDVNEEWYRVCKLKSLWGMSRLWLTADYVKCILPGRAVFTGYEKVLQSWAIRFQWDQHHDPQLRDVQARVFGDMAWVTFKEFFNAAIGPVLATNIFEFHNGQWFMVHHHSSPMVEVGIADPMVLV